VQAAVSAIALAVGSSTSTKSMMDRMADMQETAEAEKKRGGR
jgi:hypothetical protein